MKPKSLATFLILCTAITPLAVFASDGAPSDGSRYFLKSTNGVWKKALGARHEFSEGFSADLSFMQLRFARFGGLDPVSLQKYSILDDEDIIADSRLTPTSRVPWGVDLLTGSDTVPSGGASVSVAVLDTGVADHPDLSRRVVDCRDYTLSAPAVVDGTCEDRNGHGTHVAGIIAADGGEDGQGIIGMAPEATLRIFKVCSDQGSCWPDDIAVAIREATDAGVQIINLSMGSDAVSPLIEDAVSYASTKGVLLVAAAGNDGPYPESVDYPASSEGVVAVDAVDGDLAIPDWSSRGVVELSAPGANIESTFKDGSYGILSGTSMAAGHISGLAARAWVFDSETPASSTFQLLKDLGRDNMPLVGEIRSEATLPVLQ